MDFLDPQGQRTHTIRLLIGYILLGIAILLATIILLYQAYGFSLNDKGKIIQNGLVFVSSTPSGSSVLVDGIPKATTNTRLTLPAGSYTLQINRSGYRSWNRAATVVGGTVVRFSYPLLFPKNLVTTTLKTYEASPTTVSQSPDQRWLLVGQSSTIGEFDRYDLNSPKQAPTSFVLPSGILTPNTDSTQSLSVVSWASDNRHVLLKHVFGGSYEYILLDTQTPSNSINLTKTLGLNATSAITLQNREYDHYFVYDTKTLLLGTSNLGNVTIAPLLQSVLAYQTATSNVILYATTQGAPCWRGTRIMIYQDGKSYQIRTVTQSATYLLALTQYSGSWYVATGVSSENRVYVYQDPATILQQK